MGMLNRSITLFVSQLTSYGVRLVVPFFLVRLMTVAEFGAYRQFFLLELYIALLFQFGSNQSLYYFVPRNERNAGAYFVNCLMLNILTFTAAFTLIGLVREPVSVWLNMAILNDLFWYLVIYKFIWIQVISCDCYLLARQKVKASALFGVLGQVVVSIMTVTAAFYWRDVERIILAMTVARTVQLVGMLAFIQFRLHGFRAEKYLEEIWSQLRYGVVLGMAGTVWTVQARLHQLFISRYYGTESFAIYSVGCTDIPIMQLFSQSVSVVALGRFAVLERQKDWNGIRNLWTRILTGMYAVAGPTIILLLIVSEPLIRIWFTETYIDAVPIFRISALMKLQYILNATLVLRAMNRNDVSIWVNLAILLVTPFALYSGMTVGGMTGVITAQLFLLLAGRLILMTWLNRISKADLGYFARPRAIIVFYRETFSKVKGHLLAQFRREATWNDGASS
jgi:O-antigen/teichoic acid export membrane protein